MDALKPDYIYIIEKKGMRILMLGLKKKDNRLHNIISKRLLKSLLLTMLIVLFSITITFSFFIRDWSFEKVNSGILNIVGTSLGDINYSLSVRERSYNESISKLLEGIDIERGLSVDNLDNERIEGKIEGLASDIKFPPGLSLGDLNYYLINPDGIVEVTNKSSHLGFDISQRRDLWYNLKGIDSNEVVLNRPTFDNLNRELLNKEGYIKLATGYIFKVDLPMEDTLFRRYNNRILSDDFTIASNINLYTQDFIPVREGADLLDDGEKEVFKGLDINKNGFSFVEKVKTNYQRTLYIRWNVGPEGDNLMDQNYFLKINTDFYIFKIIERLIAVSVIIILIISGLTMTFFNRRLYNRILKPFSSLISSMKDLSLRDNPELLEIEDQLERTEIKEVNLLISTYQNMVSELSSNFEEIKAMNEELDQSYGDAEELNLKFKEVIKLPGRLIDSTFKDNYDVFLIKLLHYGFELISGVDYGAIFILRDGEWQCIETIGHNEKLKGIKLDKEFFCEMESDILVSDYEKMISDSSSKEVKEEFLSNLKGLKESIINRLIISDKIETRIFLDVGEGSAGGIKSEDKEVMKAYIDITKAVLTMHYYGDLQEKVQKEIIFSIINILEIHDNYTKGHSENVAKISVDIARAMGIDEKELDDVYWAGLVHDIGKILISKGVLNKPSRLTEQEYKEIKKHSSWGYEVLNNVEELENISDYIKYHHERWDGSGYPEGLKGEDIPLVSRILAVADAWDTMRSDRVYRSKLDKEFAIGELKKNKGTQFAPEIVDLVLQLIEKGEV